MVNTKYALALENDRMRCVRMITHMELELARFPGVLVQFHVNWIRAELAPAQDIQYRVWVDGENTYIEGSL